MTRMKIERAKRAIAHSPRFTDDWGRCRSLRGLFSRSKRILGFRFAAPQALRYRHASRA